MSEKFDPVDENTLRVATAIASLMGRKIIGISFDDETDMLEIKVETGATLQVKIGFNILNRPELTVSLT